MSRPSLIPFLVAVFVGLAILNLFLDVFTWRHFAVALAALGSSVLLDRLRR